MSLLLRIEGLLIGAAALLLYWQFDQSWWLFFALILVPDLSMLGYLRGPKVGAWCYNIAHTYSLPAIMALVAWLVHQHYGFSVALIWVAHIGIDRALGYGLKLPTGFKDTHLGRVGKS